MVKRREINKYLGNEVRVCYVEEGNESCVSGTIDKVDDDYIVVTKESGSSANIDLNSIAGVELIIRKKVLMA